MFWHDRKISHFSVAFIKKQIITSKCEAAFHEKSEKIDSDLMTEEVCDGETSKIKQAT